MIANAGIVRSTPLLESSYLNFPIGVQPLIPISSIAPVEQWDEVLTVNGRSTFLCYKYAAKQMIAQGHGGKIVGATSLAGKQGHCSPIASFHSSS